MISSAIWDKSTQFFFARARRANVSCGLTSADLFQIAREKSCDYLLIINMQKFDLLFLFYVSPLVTAPCSGLKMTSSTKIGLNFDK